MSLEKNNEELRKQNRELTTKLVLAENNLKSSVNDNVSMERNFKEMNSELNLLRSNYDEVVHQNKIMNEELYNKNSRIETMSIELQNLRNLLTKLTDVKNILNQHLTSNSGNSNIMRYFN